MIPHGIKTMLGNGAPVVELVDAADSKSAVRKDVPVRVRSGAPNSNVVFRFT